MDTFERGFVRKHLRTFLSARFRAPEAIPQNDYMDIHY